MYRVALLSTLLGGGLLFAAPQPQSFRRPLVFEPNRGQAPADVMWLARAPGYEVGLTREGVAMVIHEHAGGPPNLNVPPAALRVPRPLLSSLQSKYSIVRMKLPGGQPWKTITGAEPTGGVSNYLPDASLKNALTDVPHYAKVRVASVYKGIDLVFYSNDGGNLEYDFVVAPGADPRQIQVAFDGMKNMREDRQSGDLVLTMPGGAELRQNRPRAYQQIANRRIDIGGGYRLLGPGRAAFTLAAYDRTHTLVIDPTVAFTTFFGGSSAEQPAAIAVDASGNTYVTGGTYSRNFPVTNGSSFEFCKSFDFLGFCGTGPNIFVAKFDAAGTLVFASYGGVGSGAAIAVDSSGAYATGDIFPPDIDNIIGFSDNNNGDIFVWKLTQPGQQGYFQILGVDGIDYGSGIALDSFHNAWVTGSVYSGGSFDRTGDIFVLKLDPNGRFLHSQNYGSNGEDNALAITIDTADQAWITGRTCGDGFPTTNGQVAHVNGCGVFVLQLERAGNQRMGMVFGGIGGSDVGAAIVSNGNNSAYVAGYTNTPGFPVTVDGFQTVRTASGFQGFITQVESSTFQGRIVHSTLLGSDGITTLSGIANDNAGGVYVAGTTSSVHFPGAPPLVPNPTAGFVSKLSFNLTQLQYTKLLGAVVSGVAVVKSATRPNEVYTTGWRYTGGSDFDHIDGFVVKLIEDLPTSAVAPMPPQVATPTFTVTWAATDVGTGVAIYDVFVSDNGGPFTPFQTATTATSATFTGLPGHSYGFYSIATDAAGHRESPKTVPDIVVTIGATPPTILCSGCYFLINGARATLAFNVTAPGSGSTFVFNFRNSTQTVQFASTTISQIAVNGGIATFSGQGKVNGQTGYNFTVTATDGGGAGSGLDTLAIAITGPSNYSFSATGTIAGGDIVAHQ